MRLKASINREYEVRRFANGNRAMMRLKPIAASANGEASSRYRQMKPSNPGPELTLGIKSNPNDRGALMLSASKIFE
jgi:hypothetical protein